jgi:hypothetical protein
MSSLMASQNADDRAGRRICLPPLRSRGATGHGNLLTAGICSSHLVPDGQDRLAFQLAPRYRRSTEATAMNIQTPSEPCQHLRLLWLLVLPLVGAAVSALITNSVAHGAPRKATITPSPPESVRLELKPLARSVDGSRIATASVMPSGRIAVGTTSGTIEPRDSDGYLVTDDGKLVGATTIDQIALSRGESTYAVKTLSTNPDGSPSGEVFVVKQDTHRTHVFQMPEFANPGSLTIALDNDGSRLARADISVTIIDTRTFRTVADLDQGSIAALPKLYSAAAFSKDDRSLVASGYYSTDIWDTSSWRLKADPVRLCGPSNLSPNSRWSSCGTFDGHVIKWGTPNIARQPRTYGYCGAQELHPGGSCERRWFLVSGSCK